LALAAYWVWQRTEENPEVLSFDNGPSDTMTGCSIIIHKEKPWRGWHDFVDVVWSYIVTLEDTDQVNVKIFSEHYSKRASPMVLGEGRCVFPLTGFSMW